VCLNFPGLESQSDLFQVAGKHAFSRTVTLSREEDTHFPAPRLLITDTGLVSSRVGPTEPRCTDPTDPIEDMVKA